MDHARDGSALPTVQELRHTLDEQDALLRGPSLPDVVEVRVHRIARTLSDLLELPDSEDLRVVATRAIAWTAESVGAFQRLPQDFAFNAAAGQLSPALTLVDDLDLLGLTLDHAYDALSRQDSGTVAKQLTVLDERFGTSTEPIELVEEGGVTEDDLDQERVEEHGLEVGDDGIPRMPVPEQPDPHHETPHETEEASS